MSRFLRVLWLCVLIMIMVGCFTVTAHAQLKIGYIRSQYIFEKYAPYKEAEKQLEEFHKKEMSSLQKMNDDLQQRAKEAEQKSLLMTDEMKRQKLEELRKQEEEINRQYEELYKDDGVMVKKQTELMQPIIDRINEVIMRVAENEEYDYILDATASSGGQILFANEKYDISDQILGELQKSVTTK